MAPDLYDRLTALARWHAEQALKPINAGGDAGMHRGATADIRAVIVFADDATRNLLIRRKLQADHRRFSDKPEPITGFGGLMDAPVQRSVVTGLPVVHLNTNEQAGMDDMLSYGTDPVGAA